MARLSSVRPAATVKAELGGLLADPKVGTCSVMDGPRSKAACPKVAALRAELGNAERREKLETDLAGLQTAGPANATDKPADAGAHALSVYLSALGFVLPERLLTDWLTIVPVLALEVAAALSLVLVQAVGGVQPGQETPRQVEQNADNRAPGTASGATDGLATSLGQQNASDEA